MSNQTDEVEEDDIPETDFSEGVRGKYYERASQRSNVVLLEPEVGTVFPGAKGGATPSFKENDEANG
jgi:hypothetical protein